MGVIQILEPVVTLKEEAEGYAPRPTTLAGKTLGLLSNGWRSFDTLMDAYEELALGKHGVAKVIHRRHWNASGSAPDEFLEEMAKCDVAFVGLGH